MPVASRSRMSLVITILGCGSSGGVPARRPGLGRLRSDTTRENRRRRCSILVERDGSRAGATTSVLVDTSPDLREQLLSAEVKRLDGVLITHDHADHVHGIDDLRPLVIHMRRRIPCLCRRPDGATLHDPLRLLLPSRRRRKLRTRRSSIERRIAIGEPVVDRRARRIRSRRCRS